MSREFVPVVTGGVVEWAMNGYQQKAGESGVSSERMRDALSVALVHPDFRAQLRAYVAEQMWGLVPVEVPLSCDCERCDCGNNGDAQRAAAEKAHNTCRAETLANIAAYEKE